MILVAFWHPGSTEDGIKNKPKIPTKERKNEYVALVLPFKKKKMGERI